MPSPTTPIAAPRAIVLPVGSDSQSTTIPNTNPSATRKRASRSNTRGFDGETTLDRPQNLVDLDVLEAHRVAPAAAQMMAFAYGVARDGDVTRRPRAVARRPRGSVNADERSRK